MSGEIYVLGALRTPIGKFLGGLARRSAVEFATDLVRVLLERSRCEGGQVDELIFGCARQAGLGPNPARQIAVRAGLPVERTAYTVNMACGSGLLAILEAMESIRRGDSDIVIAGGTESMTRLPYYLLNARTGYRLGSGELVDGMYRDGFQCPLADQLMGETAENLAEEFKIGREEQDQYAAETQRRAEVARKEGRFANEIVPVPTGDKAQPMLERDEHPRDGVTAESLKKLEPVFKKGGGVHAGNSSGITDGAAALLIASEKGRKQLGLEPLVRLGAATRAGVEPRRMGMGPVPAVKRLLEKTSRKLTDIDLIELNEAFAAQVIACDRELHLDRSRLNVNGGAIALGHPIGATGARITVTLIHELRRRRAARGIATLCISGGMGLALEVTAA